MCGIPWILKELTPWTLAWFIRWLMFVPRLGVVISFITMWWEIWECWSSNLVYLVTYFLLVNLSGPRDLSYNTKCHIIPSLVASWWLQVNQCGPHQIRCWMYLVRKTNILLSTSSNCSLEFNKLVLTCNSSTAINASILTLDSFWARVEWEVTLDVLV